VSYIGNMMLHAMRTWPQCRVHWLVETPIDSPRMWVADETWKHLAARLSMGRRKPRGWPRPKFVSVWSIVHSSAILPSPSRIWQKTPMTNLL
jgi:hypothetical protein